MDVSLFLFAGSLPIASEPVRGSVTGTKEQQSQRYNAPENLTKKYMWLWERASADTQLWKCQAHNGAHSSRSSWQGRQDRLPQAGWLGRQLRAGAGQAAVQSKKISSVDNSWGTYCFVPAGTTMRAKDLFSQSGSWLQVQHSWSPWPQSLQSLSPEASHGLWLAKYPQA